jgi:hypothetical protein
VRSIVHLAGELGADLLVIGAIAIRWLMNGCLEVEPTGSFIWHLARFWS